MFSLLIINMLCLSIIGEGEKEEGIFIFFFLFFLFHYLVSNQLQLMFILIYPQEKRTRKILTKVNSQNLMLYGKQGDE